MATALKSVPTVAEDDGVREIHGVRTIGTDHTVRVTEDGDRIKLFQPSGDRYLTPRQARYLARQLRHLALRVERRELTA